MRRSSGIGGYEIVKKNPKDRAWWGDMEHGLLRPLRLFLGYSLQLTTFDFQNENESNWYKKQAPQN